MAELRVFRPRSSFGRQEVIDLLRLHLAAAEAGEYVAGAVIFVRADGGGSKGWTNGEANGLLGVATLLQHALAVEIQALAVTEVE